MASNNTIPPDAILNPYTPLAFMPREVADQYQVVCYVCVATLAAYTWDWLMSMPEEYTAFRKLGFSPPNVAYLLSRFGTFGFCVATTVFRVAPLRDCTALRYVEGIFFEVTLPATSILFFFRVKAVYNHSRIVTAFFGFLWLAITGLSVLVMLGIRGERIPYTQRCTEALAHAYTTVPIILASVNDTLVFLAISYRMVSLSLDSSTWTGKAKSFIMGDGLQHLSKALLHSGQAYYFVTIGVAITSTALILSSTIPPELHTVLCSPYFGISSAMACRVFRSVLLGIIKDPHLNTARISTITHGTRNTLQPDDVDITMSKKHDESDLSSNLKVNVAVETDTRAESYDGDTFWEQLSLKDDVPQDASQRV